MVSLEFQSTGPRPLTTNFGFSRSMPWLSSMSSLDELDVGWSEGCGPGSTWGVPKLPTKWCIILGCEMGIPPFKETPTSGKQAVIKGHDQ